MRQNFSNNTCVGTVGPKLRGAMARRKALLMINLALMIAFISTSVVAAIYSTSYENPAITISGYELDSFQSITGYNVNPAVPGWK